jgi:hypothetical protein
LNPKALITLGLILVAVSIAAPLIFYSSQTGANAFFNKLADSTFVSGSWRPSGGYALMAGLEGAIYRFDGTGFVDLSNAASKGANWHDISWKPDGSAFITGIETAQSSQLVALSYDGGSLTEEPRSGWQTTFPASSTWNPNGSYALILAGNGFARFDGDRFSEFNVTRGFYCRSASWKPDGSYALVTSQNYSQGTRYHGMLCKYDGEDLSVLYKDLPMMLDCAWKPDGSYALLVGENHTVAKFDGESVAILTSGDRGNYVNVAWKPDGSYAIVTGETSMVQRFDGKNFSPLPIAGGAQYIWASWLPDGSSALIYGLVPRYIHISSETGTQNMGGGFVWRYDGDHLTQLTPLITDGPSLWPYLGAASVGAVVGLSAVAVAVRGMRRELRVSGDKNETGA